MATRAPRVVLKWGHWFELSVEAWDHFRKEKILASTWVSAYLNCSEWSPNVWQRELYIDVSADFIGLEIELLQKLAQHIDVTVFAPEEKWIEQYPTTLWPYQVLAGKKIEFSKSEQNSGLNIANANCKRFSTQISEVKSAIAQIRTWLNEGCSPGQLAVVAADIEAYWPALEAYAQREGIPVAKDMVLAAASLPNLGRWISRLKIESQDIESATLEQALYTDQSEPMYGFEKFKQLFSRIYDESDLKRDSHLRELFKFKYSGVDKLKRDEFLVWALQYWQGESVGLENLSALFLNECPVHIKLELRSWISYLVGLIAKVEVKIKEGDASGIYCVNFDSAQNLNVNKCILLGLSDSDLQAAKINLSQNEVQMIGQDLGFYLESPDQQQNSFLAHYLATQVKDEVSLYFSATSFAGEALGPSLFWLQNALKSKDDLEKIDLPQMTRWDELQMSDIQTMGHEGLRENLEIEMGVREFQQIAELPPLRFSATQIEKYLSCPFIFLTEKLFHLSDFPEVDLDLDAMSNGRLMHAVLERVLAPQLTLNRTPQDLANLIDEVRIALAITVGDERLWASKRNQYLRMVTQFLELKKTGVGIFRILKPLAEKWASGASSNFQTPYEFRLAEKLTVLIQMVASMSCSITNQQRLACTITAAG